MILPRRLALALALCGLLLTGAVAWSQPDLYHVLVRSSRVAVLPPANLSGDADASLPVLQALRAEMQRQGAEVAADDDLRVVLRDYRIRNTAEVSLENVRTIADALSVRYFLLGSIDRYSAADSAAEFAVSARILDAVSGTVVWANSVQRHRDPRARIFGLGRTAQPADLITGGVRKLLHGVRYSADPQQLRVTALQLAGKTQAATPCRTLAVVTLGNETQTRFAGHVLANQLTAALLHRGFDVVDPGRVRALMLDTGQLVQGEAPRELLNEIAADLGADYVLTGTVSRFQSLRSQNLDNPEVSLEVRLIDLTKGTVVWAASYDREGDDSALVFGIGHVHGLTQMSARLARRIALDLPAVRTRSTSPQPEANL